MERAVDHDLPREIDYLRRHDEARTRIMDVVEIPDRMAENLILYIRKDNGALGRERRENEFAKLTDTEVTSVQEIVREARDTANRDCASAVRMRESTSKTSRTIRGFSHAVEYIHSRFVRQIRDCIHRIH